MAGTAFKSLTLGSLVLTDADYTTLTGLINAKVASVTAGDNSVTIGGTATAPTVAAKISAASGNLLELAADGLKVIAPTAAEYTLTKQTTADTGYAATYQLFKDGTAVGDKIQIVKDQFLKSATFVTQDGSGNPGKFLKFEWQLGTAEGGIATTYVDVEDLVDVYTSGSAAGDQIVIDITDNKITATLAAGSVTNAQLAGNIAESKLDTATQTKIDNGAAAKTAVDAILDGTDLDSFADVETALDGKQDTLTFDNAPTSGSDNPVKSGGVFTALGGKCDKVSGLTDSTTVAQVLTSMGCTFAS